MLEYFLKLGSCYAKDFTYEIPEEKYIGITEEEAVERYEKIVRENCLLLKEQGYEFTLSGGLDSSLMFVLAEPERAFCCQVDGNKDYAYAQRLYPDVIKESSFMDISMESQIIESQKLWDRPHCRRSDFYDYHVYHQYPKVAVGEHPNWCNYLRFLKHGRKSRMKMYIDMKQIFSDDEVREFGYTPPELELKNDTFEDFQAMVEDWTLLARRIFYHFRGKVESPYLMKNANDFLKGLPIHLKTNKKLIKAVAKRNLPEFICARRKSTNAYKRFDPKWAKYRQIELNNLIEKYLLNPEMKIFEHIPYEVSRKHRKSFMRAWNLLNLAIWFEVHDDSTVLEQN